MTNPTVQCPKCAVINTTDSRFCTKCGSKLTFACKRCGADNFIGTEYCKSCGTKTAEAKFWISDERAVEWWKHFNQWPGFFALWGGKSYVRTTVVGAALDLQNALEPNPPYLGEGAFIVPITPRDWCVKSLQWGTEQITNGYLSVRAIGISAYDFERRAIKRLYYEELSTIQMEGDAIMLNTADENRIVLSLQVPRPSKASKAFLVVNVLANALAGQSIADRELGRQGIRRDTDDYWAKVKLADNYVSSLFLLFSEIIEKKQNLETD